MGILLQSGKRRTLVGRNGVIASKRRGPAVSYLLRDDFTDTVAAGSVDGTAATPGPGVRDTIDSQDRLSIGGGTATIDGKASILDPSIGFSTLVSRSAGRLVLIGISAQTNSDFYATWQHALPSSPREGMRFRFDGFVRALDNSGQGANIYLRTQTDVVSAGALRATGSFSLLKESGIWRLLWTTTTNSDASMFPRVSTDTAGTIDIDFVRVPEGAWLPVPLVSDGAFGAATDGLGHAEGIAGGIGAGGSGLPWTDNKGTWSGASASALSGGEAIRTVDAGNADVFADLDITRTGGNASLILRYTDDNNYLRLGTDGTNAVLVEKVGGVENTLSTTAITYGAGNTMRIRLEGQAARIYYNDAFVVAESTIDASLTGTRIGLYTTDTGNSFDNLVAYKSTGYTELDQYAN